MEEEKGKYINTEFGKVPSDWRYCTFKDVLITFSSGATPYRAIAEYYKGKIRWISSGELNYNVIYDTLEHISEAAVKNTNLKIHEPGTFLMAITGLEAEGTRGRCAIIGAPSTTNQSCLALNGTSKMTTDYLFWFYRQYGNYLAFKYCQGTKQQSYTAAIIKKLPICCPKDPNQQTAIATALSDTDALIGALDKKIAKKQQIKQGAMQQLLTGKKRLPEFGGKNKYKETEIGLIPEDWEVIEMENLSEKIMVGIASSATFAYRESGVVMFRNQNIHPNFLDDSEVIFLDPKYELIYKNKRLKKGDLLTARTGYPGTTCKVSGKYEGSQSFTTLISRIKEDAFNIDYLCYYINSEHGQAFFEQNKIGGGQKNINAATLKLMPIPIPPSKSEQAAIVQILTDMDQEIARLEKKRDKYVQLKAGMMQVLLTGKIRLIKN